MNTVTNIDVTVHSAPEHHAVQVRMNVMWVLAALFCEAKLYIGLRSYRSQGNLIIVQN